MQLNFSNIKVQPLQIANNDISQDHIEFCKLVEGLKHVDLPADYLKFIEEFGEGVIGNYLKIYPVRKLMEYTKPWRECNPTKAEEIFFKKHNRADCTLIGEIDGDTIFYLNNQYYFSTRNFEEKIYILGNTLNDLLLFFKHDNNYGKMDIDKFVPFDSSL